MTRCSYRLGVNHGELTAGGKVTLTINNGDATSTVELKLVNGVLQLAPNGQAERPTTTTAPSTDRGHPNPDGRSLTVVNLDRQGGGWSAGQ